MAFFTPLVYFLAGHYLDPWDAGEGGLQNGLTFVFFFCLTFYFIGLLQNCSKLLYCLVSILGIFSWFLGVLWIYFVGLLGPLESFLCGPKSEKMSNVPRENDFFEKEVFFLVSSSSWWSSWVHLGFFWADLVPEWIPIWVWKFLQTVHSKMLILMTKRAILDSKNVAKICLKWDRHLKAFFTTHAFFLFFFGRFFYGPLELFVCFLAALGFLVGLFGCFWIQKH